MRIHAIIGLLIIVIWSPAVYAVGSCGGVSDDCQCGSNNPYPCCNNGNGKSSNCTWGAWHKACCHWGVGMPAPWQHAKYWAGNYASHPDYDVVSNPVEGSIGCKADGYYGHVAWVTGVSGSTVYVNEQSCCEGSTCWPNCSWCIHGFADSSYNKSYFTGGFIVKKGAVVNPCGDGSCNNGENCDSCPQDCGQCEYCGDGKCNGGENCDSCSKDCGQCETCGNGNCGGNENCDNCSKDCGQCCGNGKCDYGESCSSCESDCGICNDPPIGELQVVNCAVIAGWARDPDTDQPIAVRIVASGTEVATVQADGPNVDQPGHGFSYAVGHELKDGQLLEIEAVATDEKGLADAVIAGSGKKLLCRNGLEQMGIWTIEYQDSAGLDVAMVPSSDQTLCKARLFHDGGLPYPVSGVTLARSALMTTPFEKISAAACGGFANPMYAAMLSVDGEGVAALGEEMTSCTPVEFVAGGTDVELRLQALSMTEDPEGRQLALDDLRLWSRGWQVGYGHDAAGMIVGNPRADRVEYALRPAAEGCVGQLTASRNFAEPFTGVELMLDQDPGPVQLTLSNAVDPPVALSDCAPGVNCKLDQLQGNQLQLNFDCGEGVELAPDWKTAVGSMRIFRNVDGLVPPWTIKGQRIWGLEAVVPPDVGPGLALRISSLPQDFIPTGTLKAHMSITLPMAQEIRGMLSYELPGQCYSAFMSVDDNPVQMFTTGVHLTDFVIDTPAAGFGMGLTAGYDCDTDPPEAHLEVTNVSYKRAGWWTTPSAGFAGIRDLRDEGCGIRFENLKWWGNSQNVAYGSMVVHRFFEEGYTGLRYTLQHNFASEAFLFQVLAENQPVETSPLTSPTEATEELSLDEFRHVGFRFAVVEDGVYPHKWEVSVSDIQLYSADEGWVSACAAAEGKPRLEGVEKPPVQPDVITGADAFWTPSDGVVEPASPKKSGGCSTAGSAPASLWLLLLLIFALGFPVVRRIFPLTH